jgi:pimeloyl-ACP methyl ester carboxylesterase
MSGSELHSYGGDAKILATREEIDRVMAELHALEGWLRSQVELPDFAIDPVLRVRLALELPPILEKLNQIRDACGLAADSYFGAEAEISRELREGRELPVAQLAGGIASMAAGVGLLVETKVSANLVGVSNAISPPNSIGSLAERLIAGSGAGVDGKSAWLRIEKFREPASPVKDASGQMVVPEARYVVYIPGTQSWAPRPGANPFDLTSNLSAISKTGFAGSERAVALAMKQAGIGPDSKVLLVGHSQGGMVAANISTRFAGSSVLTFGSPLGQLAGKLIAPTLSVEHERDPVPKLDSRPNPLAVNWVTVRHVLAGSDPIAQHEMAGYLATAQTIDVEVRGAGADEEGLAKIRKEIAGFAGEAAGQAYFFEVKREP